MAIRVFMVGKSDTVMAEMAKDMGPDFEVSHFQDAERAAREFDPAKYDVVILGRALKAPDREKLLGTVHELPVLISLAPQGKLSAAHARAALSAADKGPKVLTVTGTDGGHVRFDLTKQAEVTVTLYTLSLFQYLLDIRPAFQGTLDAGSHEVAIPRSFKDRFERKHLYVAADNGDAYLIHLPGL